MRISPLDKAVYSRRGAWLLAGAVALATVPAACSHDGPGTTGDREAGPMIGALITPAAAKIASIRARFPGALVAADGGHLVAEAAGETLRPALAEGARRRATVDLPRRADGAIHLTDDASHLAIAFTLEGAAPAPAVIDGGLAIYPAAAPGGGDVLHVPDPSGTEDLVHFEHAPTVEALRYHLDVGHAAGLRLVANTLELLDAGGTPLLRVATPYVLDADGRRHEATLSLEGCAADTSPRAPFGRPVTAAGAAFCTIVVDWSRAHVAYPALVDPVWGSTLDTLITARLRHTMTLLNPTDPKSLVLVAGGFAAIGGAPLKTAEVYDPLSRRFTATGSLAVARGAHTATLLTQVTPPAQLASPSPVLVAGGADGAGTPLGSLEIYDPASGLFATDPSVMSARPRFEHSATLIGDSTVLLAGGTTLPLNQPTNSAYVYTLQSFTGGVAQSTLVPTVGVMTTSRTGLAATRLSTGKVLLTGGFVLGGGSLQALQTAEIYDPTTDAFTAVAGQMSGQRGYHTATPIGGGLVVIVGGVTKTVGGTYPSSVDLYADGSVGSVTGFLNQGSPITIGTPRASHSATLLANGDVLVAGGYNASGALSAVEIFSSATKTFSPLNALAPMAVRGDHAALLVSAGDSTNAGHTVLVSGGSTSSTTGTTALASAQILLNLDGDPCKTADDCLSGFCADGVCCDTACDQECYACSAAKKQSNAGSGTCGFAVEGTTPQVQCINEIEVHTQCDGKGSTEQTDKTRDCKPGTCGVDGLCSTSCMLTSDCSATGFCDLTSPNDAGAGGFTCAPKRIDSTTCTADEQCTSGHCVDGVCCDTACGGQCQACDIPGLLGKCFPIGTDATPAQPHPNAEGTTKRQACDGVQAGVTTSCSGYCVGVTDAQKCFDPDATKTLHATTCADVAGAASILTAYPCDGHGSSTEVPGSCGGYLCADASLCKTACTADTDCIADWVCVAGACKKLDGPLCDGTHILRKPAAQGGNTPCPDHYSCPADATTCRTDCDAVTDCSDDFVCNGARKCVERLPPAVITSCATHLPGAAADGALGLALSLAAIALFRRRSR